MVFEKRNTLGRFNRNKDIDAIAPEFIEKYKTGMSLNRLSKEYGISMIAIKKRLLEAGIKVSSSRASFKPSRINKDINRDFLIWLVGFFEADGHLRLNKQVQSGKKYPNYQFGITQANKEVLDSIKDALGVGSVYLTHPEGMYGHNKDCYVYTLSNSKDILKLIVMMKPFIHLKKRMDEINNAIIFFEKKGLVVS